VTPRTSHHAGKFVGPHEHRIFKGAGHNLPQERPEDWARTVIDARRMAEKDQGTKGVIAR
jgi:pimeloyl-ACP methyl ester carboxylesterase